MEDILKVFFIFSCAFVIVKVKDFIHYGLGHMEIGFDKLGKIIWSQFSTKDLSTVLQMLFLILMTAIG